MTQHDYEQKPNITVIGVGGAGGNAVNNMIQSNLEGVDFVVANTDAQALKHSLCQNRVQLGTGLGAGAVADVGRQAAEDAADQVREQLEGANMAFITAGMGGGTGTGAAPVIARIAKEMGILTIGVVTKPFHFEGAHRMRGAEKGIEALQGNVDTLIMIPNQNLFRICDTNTTFADAFKMADSVLHSGVRSVTDLIVMPGLINLDFADIRSVMRDMGKAMMGMGEGTGEKRAAEAAQAAVTNPLLDDVSLSGARGVLINITGGMDMTLFEVDEVANRIREEVDPDAQIIFGSAFDESMEGKMRVSVVATGFDRPARRENAELDAQHQDPSEKPAAARAFSVVSGAAALDASGGEEPESGTGISDPGYSPVAVEEDLGETLSLSASDPVAASDDLDEPAAFVADPEVVSAELQTEEPLEAAPSLEPETASQEPDEFLATDKSEVAETVEALPSSGDQESDVTEVDDDDDDDQEEEDLAAKVSSIWAKQSNGRSPVNGSSVKGHSHQNGNAALDVSSIFIEQAEEEAESEEDAEEEEAPFAELNGAPLDEELAQEDAASDEEDEDEDSETRIEPLVGSPVEEDEAEDERKIAVNASAAVAEGDQLSIEEDDEDDEGGNGPRRGFLRGLARGFGRGSRDEETGKAVLERLKGCQRLNTGEA
jgi:cell division protein FtsZ